MMIYMYIIKIGRRSCVKAWNIMNGCIYSYRGNKMKILTRRATFALKTIEGSK